MDIEDRLAALEAAVQEIATVVAFIMNTATEQVRGPGSPLDLHQPPPQTLTLGDMYRRAQAGQPFVRHRG